MLGGQSRNYASLSESVTYHLTILELVLYCNMRQLEFGMWNVLKLVLSLEHGKSG